MGNPKAHREKLVGVVRDYVVNAQACLPDLEGKYYDKLAHALFEATIALDEIYTLDGRDSRFKAARAKLLEGLGGPQR
jgi:hypothetical protein